VGLRCSITLQIALFLDLVHSLVLHKGKQCFGYWSRSVLKPSDIVALGRGGIAGTQPEANKMSRFHRWTSTSINYRHVCTLGQVTSQRYNTFIMEQPECLLVGSTPNAPVRLMPALTCDSLYIRPVTLVGAWIFLFRIGRYSRDFIRNPMDLIILQIVSIFPF